MKPELPKIAIQLVTYWSKDGAVDIDLCMRSIERVRYPKDRLAIVIVDNPSPSGSASEYMQKNWLHKSGDNFPETFFVKNKTNTGFAGGHERAYTESKKWGAEAVYLLNQDAVMDRGALERIVEVMVNNPEMAIVQSRIMLFDKPELLNSKGNCLHYLGFGYSDGNGTKPDDSGNQHPHFYASGAAMLARLSVVDKIGGLFDERYFMYHEDVDISWRARLAGYQIGYAHDSIVYHRYEFSRSVEKFFFMERNRLITHFTHLKFKSFVLVLVPMLVSEIAGLVFSVRAGWLDKKVSAYKALLSREVRDIIKERRKLSFTIRVVGDRDIFKHMVGVIEAQEVTSPIIKYIANPLLNTYFKVLKFVMFW